MMGQRDTREQETRGDSESMALAYFADGGDDERTIRRQRASYVKNGADNEGRETISWFYTHV